MNNNMEKIKEKIELVKNRLENINATLSMPIPDKLHVQALRELLPELIEDTTETIQELEEYEQNFKQKEFEYRTDCQNLVSAGRVEAENMPDRFTELEKVILYHYLGQGYEIGVGEWKFNVDIFSFYKSKRVRVIFWDYEKDIHRIEYNKEYETTKEMFDKAIAHFTTNQNTVVEEN